jgi:hypothetical protein
MKNLLYLAYFIIKTNYSDLKKSFICCKKNGYSRVKLLFDMIYCSLRYGSSFVDYFNFRFYNKKHHEKKAYATMGYMYRFHKKVNDKNKINEVDNKNLFPIKFSKYCNKSYSFQKHEKHKLLEVIKSKNGKKIVFKDPNSTAGKSIRICQITLNNQMLFIDETPFDEFIKKHFLKSDSIYFEDFIEQHDAINEISPSGVNTLRIITLINNNMQVEVIGSVFRISVDCPIDNYSAGNLAAEIDPVSGIVITGGIRKRSSCDVYHNNHPSTGKKIKGFEIPFWKETIKMVKEAAIIVPEVRSVGWDVAITNKGPVLIEGNSKWNKDTWQIPAGFGKKHIIENILKN